MATNRAGIKRMHTTGFGTTGALFFVASTLVGREPLPGSPNPDEQRHAPKEQYQAVDHILLACQQVTAG